MKKRKFYFFSLLCLSVLALNFCLGFAYQVKAAEANSTPIKFVNPQESWCGNT